MMVKTLEVRSIIDAVASAAAVWTDPGFAPRGRAREAVAARTGYALAAVDSAFDSLFGSLTSSAITSVIEAELGSPNVLDGFVKRAGRQSVRALPAGRVCIVSSRTTIGVALPAAIFALCAKCAVLVKDREDHLVAAFFATLADRLPALGEAAAARPWNGTEDAVDLNSFDTVVAFGSDRTLEAISAALRFPRRLIAYPARTSAGYVGRASLSSKACAEAIARGAARDMLLYDGEGCLSLHALFVEPSAAVPPPLFREILIRAIDAASREFPAAASAAISSRRAMARDLARFAAASGDRVLADDQCSYLVIVDPPLEAPPPLTSRTLVLQFVDEPSQASAYLERHGVAIEALAVGARHADLASLAGRLGAARVTSFGSLQNPPLSGFHGGRPRIAEFVRWIVDET
jgi:hypothetical protein